MNRNYHRMTRSTVFSDLRREADANNGQRSDFYVSTFLAARSSYDGDGVVFFTFDISCHARALLPFSMLFLTRAGGAFRRYAMYG